MIGRITGCIVEKNPNGTVILDVHGVGFEINVPPMLTASLKPAPEKTTLFIHTIVRDDSISLYGFPSKPYLVVFKLLLQVKNIGPKLAMSILSELKPEEVGAALQREDVSKFKKISGIGNKTAQMIIVELRDKFKSISLPSISQMHFPEGPVKEAASALIHLGFKPSEVQKVIEELKDFAAEGKQAEDIVREALSRIAR